MKYKIFIFLFLSSCINNSHIAKNSFTYTAKGFAYIENLNTNNFLVSHNKLMLGTKIRILNPVNKKFTEAIVKRKSNHDDFYKISISKYIADPYIEISEIKINKSFIAKKAVTENTEKKIANKAPVDKININNLSKKKKINLIKPKKYSILVTEFYSLESANILKKKLVTILESSNYQLIYVNKINNKSYELLMGPYNTINKLKNDYSILSASGFEDLDIKIND